MTARPSTILVLSQVYVPDPASVGQHMHDAACELTRRGNRVIAYTSRRGYNDLSRIYAVHEIIGGVEVRRLPFASFGKSNLLARALGGLSYLLQASLRALFTPGLSGLLVTTSPPMGSLAGLFVHLVRRVPFTFWVMDINPDQAITVGRVGRRSLAARLLEGANRLAARHAQRVVYLDHFMAERVSKRWGSGTRAAVLPPWPHDDHLESIAHDENPFRKAHFPEGVRVLMYSGNMSPVHPLDTILEAARELQGTARLCFAFVGGGAARPLVEKFVHEYHLDNVVMLPYQPLERLRFSLSSADVHLVTMGTNLVGIVHPCKVYGAMRVGRPILFVGPDVSHIGEILRTSQAGWQLDHGDVRALVDRIRKIQEMPVAELEAMGKRGARAVADQFSKEELCRLFCDLVEESKKST